jgi:protein phosphatase
MWRPVSRLRVVAFTDVGLRRKRNEDAVLVAGWLCQTHEGAVVAMDFERTDPFVCVVADGMGGHAGGNTASRTALSVIAEGSPGWRTVDDVSATIAYANDQVRGVGAQTELEGLGTTVAGLCVTAKEIIVFNVGDSRVYSITGGWPQQLSRDDAVLDAAGNPTNVITQSLGQPGPVQTHVTTLPLQAGTYLLCSDGVSGMLTEADLRAAFSGADLAQCAANVVAATRANGAEDNFSFVIVDVPGLDSPAPPQGPPVGRIH